MHARQARCAAELMAAAQQKSVLESRSLKRKRTLGLKSYVGPPSHVLLGVRISVFWPDDHAFYKVCRLLLAPGQCPCSLLPRPEQSCPHSG